MAAEISANEKAAPVPDVDFSGACAFIRKVAGSGEITLCAISDTLINGRKAVSATFFAKDTDGIRAWLVEQSQLKRNIYYNPARLRNTVDGKASKADVAESRWLYADLDLPKSLNWGDAEAVADAMENAEACISLFHFPPTFVIFSGGGLQAGWKLKTAVPLHGAGSAAPVFEAVLKAIADALDADPSCSECSHVMRLPGTLNVPSASKRERGRTEAMAALREWAPGAVYDFSEFTDHFAEQIAESLKPRPAQPRNVEPLHPFEFERLESALRVIPSDDYHVWRTVGMALHSDGGEHGRELWDAWSLGDEDHGFEGAPGKYSAAAQDAKWQSFSEDGNAAGRVGHGSIYGMAKKLGWVDAPTPPKDEFPDVWDGLPEELRDSQAKRPAPAEARETADEAQDPIGSMVAAMNKRYAVIRDRGGRTMIMDCTFDVDGAPIRKFMFVSDFKTLECAPAPKVLAEGENKPKSPGARANVWLARFDRREYQGVVFVPGDERKTVNGYCNLWQGWGVAPAPGDWSLMREHIETVLASGNSEYAEYILKWIAWSFQNPGLPAETALVFPGGEGVGKGTLGRALSRIFGRSGIHIRSSEMLTGRFSGHLEGVCYVFADEAFWAGDRKGQGALKALVTEDFITIEAKGLQAHQMRNTLKMVIASNDDWVVPASADARRWAVFKVGKERQGDKAYFAALNAQMRDGGDAAMLHDLLALDLQGWHPRDNVPQTKALAEQKEQSLADDEVWFLSLLEEGELPPANEFGLKANQAKGSDLLSHLKATAASKAWMGARAHVKVLRHWGCILGHNECGKVWTFPPLADLREEWDAKYGKRGWNGPKTWGSKPERPIFELVSERQCGGE